MKCYTISLFLNSTTSKTQEYYIYTDRLPLTFILLKKNGYFTVVTTQKYHLELNSFLPQMSFSCITAGHSQKGLLNKPQMSVETFPGGTAPDHHHFGTAPLSSKSNVLMDGAFISSKTLLLLCCQRGGLLPAPQRKGEVFLYPLDRH